MKNLMMSFFALATISAFACPDITGNYECKDDSAADGENQINFEYNKEKNHYAIVHPEFKPIYPIGQWAYLYDELSGTTSTTTKGKAECVNKNKVTLQTLEVETNKSQVDMIIEKLTPESIVLTIDIGAGMSQRLECSKLK